MLPAVLGAPGQCDTSLQPPSPVSPSPPLLVRTPGVGCEAHPNLCDGVSILTVSYICKDPISKHVHIPRLRVDTHFWTLSSPLRQAGRAWSDVGVGRTFLAVSRAGRAEARRRGSQEARSGAGQPSGQAVGALDRGGGCGFWILGRRGSGEGPLMDQAPRPPARRPETNFRALLSDHSFPFSGTL